MKKLIIILSIHIFSVHSKLLYYLNPEVIDKDSFSFLNLSEASILALIFALSYSAATAVVIYKTDTKRIIIAYAVLDGLAVLLYYFSKIPIFVSGFYFAFYTYFLIASTISIKKPLTMKEMRSNGAKLNEIAKAFNVSTAHVSKILKSK